MKIVALTNAFQLASQPAIDLELHFSVLPFHEPDYQLVDMLIVVIIKWLKSSKQSGNCSVLTVPNDNSSEQK